jgi:hypothetical protein
MIDATKRIHLANAFETIIHLNLPSLYDLNYTGLHRWWRLGPGLMLVKVCSGKSAKDRYSRLHHCTRDQLCGTRALDRAGGSETILFDLKQRDGSKKMHETLDIDLPCLPSIGVLTKWDPEVSGRLRQFTENKDD